jgi:hypothetical protein
MSDANHRLYTRHEKKMNMGTVTKNIIGVDACPLH